MYDSLVNIKEIHYITYTKLIFLNHYMKQTRLPSEWISGTEEQSSSDYSSEEEVKRGRKF